jgi:hypothetical protein
VSRRCRIERCSIDEFEGPSPNMEKCVLATQLNPAFGDTPEPHVRKRAPYVRIDLDDPHVTRLCRTDRKPFLRACSMERIWL